MPGLQGQTMLINFHLTSKESRAQSTLFSNSISAALNGETDTPLPTQRVDLRDFNRQLFNPFDTSPDDDILNVSSLS